MFLVFTISIHFSSSSDLFNIQPLNTESPPNTEFRLIQSPPEARFTLVIDRSGSMSMSDRMEKLKFTTIRWIIHELKLNTNLGITSFSSNSNGNSATEDMPLTKITDSNRQTFVNAIERLNPNGGTCLGNGIMKGMDVSLELLERKDYWRQLIFFISRL